MNKYTLNTIIAFILLSTSVDAQSLWTNNEERFAARFPSNPTKVEAATSMGSGYAYQSIEEYSNGGALFTITVTGSIPRNQSVTQLRNYMEESNNEFIRSMGVNPERANNNWTEFGDGRPKLSYDFSFQYEGALLRLKGYWISDDNRIIRVGITIVGELSDQKSNNIIDFLDTFVILHN
ncbi:hypothetical protein [Rhodohalobacter barkolensis]|uniref:DUF1795 domain-containing protein n=1 Tax=Rhodohalobacter barkolensis TaxID=2053187 RepID=A0A2N0VH15_9BACT|nr:hypothetical protein [Rhodohalobacter barkolensis]PKD43463.1 hypothetical protein CWD77_07785 [Rhodohalobacter barkolensis]